MPHNFYGRLGPEGWEIFSRRAVGSDEDALVAEFTHFAPSRFGPWTPLGERRPGPPRGNQNAAKHRREALVQQSIREAVAAGSLVQVQIPPHIQVHYDTDLGVLTLQSSVEPTASTPLPTPDLAMLLATQWALQIVSKRAEEPFPVFNVAKVASFATFQAEVLLQASPLGSSFLLTSDPIVWER